MARYRFTRAYASHLGAWAAGEEAEFDAATAAWLSRDSPGCIEPVPDIGTPPPPPPQLGEPPTAPADDGERAPDAPPRDRMQRRRRKREG